MIGWKLEFLPPHVTSPTPSLTTLRRRGEFQLEAFFDYPRCLALNPQEQDPDGQFIPEAVLPNHVMTNTDDQDDPEESEPNPPADDPESRESSGEPGESQTKMNQTKTNPIAQSSGEPGDGQAKPGAGQANAPGESQADSLAAISASPSKQPKRTA